MAAATTAATAAPTGPLAAGDPKAATTTPAGAAAGTTAGKAGTAPTAAPTAKPTAAPTAAPTAPAAGAGEFNKGAATAALSGAAGAAKGCKKDQSGKAVVKVTFAPSGRATSAQVVGGDLQGTPAAGCIVGAFKGLSVPPFDGSPVSVQKTVSL